MRKGFTRIELLVLVLIVVTTVTMGIACNSEQQQQAKAVKCKSNLLFVGRTFQLYFIEHGQNVRYPATNGGGFVGELYRKQLLAEKEVALCPATNDDAELSDLKSVLAEDPDDLNAISYAGRKNANQKQYPGIFKLFSDTSTTSIASDDWQGTPNHEHLKLINVLYLDGHADSIRNADVDANDYDAYAKGQGHYQIADPLTN